MCTDRVTLYESKIWAIKEAIFAPCKRGLLPCTHEKNKQSILFTEMLDPYEVTLSEFAQIKHVLSVHVYKA